MIAYIARRLVMLVPVLFGVSLITFVLTRVIPGNPIDLMINPMASSEERARIAAAAGLDDPILVQYLAYVRQVLSGDLGTSFVTSRPVLSDLAIRFMPTFELTLVAILLALAFAVPLGVAAAVWRGSIVDHAARLVSIMGVGMPVFWVGLIAIYIFYFKLQWLPAPQGRIDPFTTPPAAITGLYTLDAMITGDWPALRSALLALVMPAAVLAFAAMAPLARMTRSGMIEALDSDYTRAARALGFSAWSVVMRHAFRNALLPLLTMTAIVYGHLLGGVVLIENVFAWPGLGRYVYTAITSSDYPAIQGFILYATTVYVLIFLMVDVLYTVLDPRVRL